MFYHITSQDTLSQNTNDEKLKTSWKYKMNMTCWIVLSLDAAVKAVEVEVVGAKVDLIKLSKAQSRYFTVFEI